MILVLLISLIIARYLKSTIVLSLFFAAQFIYATYLLSTWGDETEYHVAAYLALFLALSVCVFIGRIKKPIDELRIHKG